MKIISLRHVDIVINSAARTVTTKIHNTPYESTAWRDESDPKNIYEAQQQGYTGENAVWRSLVEHEILHSLVAEVLYDRPSSVILAESGFEYTPLYERYDEEAICISLQYFFNGVSPHGLAEFLTSKNHPKELAVIQRSLRKLIDEIKEEMYNV